ncbi:hypothetical protein ZIOFF_051374 [Zingiber officinale]|uniref:dUTP diphosphatase n=1 Tax=Zingiber officinale TaxID=94328 RepID=A0A8J5FIL7_ZINOF|nr:hypothetical protein ZIOFF_051374 [Zingiber officinale]
MSYINTQATSSYKEALQATEAIEAPSLGFCKPTDYKGTLSGTIATIKQANAQIQLLVTILEKLESLEERIKKIEAKANPEISILARGYEGWKNGEANILITRGLVRRLSNTPNVGFAYEVQNVVDYLASHGAVRTPTPPRYNSRDNEENDDEEQMYIVAVLTLDEEAEEVFYIKKISSTVKTPRRASKGAAGYDLAIDQDYIIPSQGQELLSTGISIKTPEGTYARIAPLSSYAMKGIIVGAGVIDSDYRADGCMEGWGGICKWKPKKYDSNSAEKICAYSRVKYNPLKSTIDAEIHAVMNSLNSFKIYYLDKSELIIRTNCQAIISFFNKSAQNKPSRVRWLALTDFITGRGIEIQFQHVNGKDNLLADALSRLVCSLIGPWTPVEKDLLILVQIEEALLQIKDKPNSMASQHLAGLMISFNNMKNWPAIQKGQVSTTKNNMTNALIWPTSSGQQSNTSLAALESLSLSASSRNQISVKEATFKDETPTVKKPYQLSMKKGLNYSKHSSTCNASHSS